MDYEKILRNLKNRGYIPYFVKTKEEAKKLVMDEILAGVHTLGKGGSQSLRDTGIWEALVERDAREDDSRIELFATTLYNQKGQDPDIALQKAMTAEAYICSTNAMTEKGTLLNVDGIGNRVGAMIYGPKKVILVIGKNKIYPDMETAWHGLKNNTCMPHASAESACRKAGKCVDCDNEYRACRVTSILDRALPGREYHLVLIDDIVGV